MRRALGALCGSLVALALAAGVWAVVGGDVVTAAEAVRRPAAATSPAPPPAVAPSASVDPVVEPVTSPSSTAAAPAATTPSPATPTATPRAARPEPRPSAPVRLQLPALDINARVEPISIGADGVLVPPGDPGRLGWWDDGAKPGARQGAALLTGHSVRRGGGALDELASAGVGAALTVEGADGGQLRYRVSSVEVMSKERLARTAGRLFAQDGPGRLVLVTCEDYRDGVWRSNVVVVAVPVAA